MTPPPKPKSAEEIINEITDFFRYVVEPYPRIEAHMSRVQLIECFTSALQSYRDEGIEEAAKVCQDKFPQSKYELTYVPDIACKLVCEELAAEIRRLKSSEEKKA